jgi:hypothetical protein
MYLELTMELFIVGVVVVATAVVDEQPLLSYDIKKRKMFRIFFSL